MGKVIRLSRNTEEHLEELRERLIRKLDSSLDELEEEVWMEYILPNDNQIIDVAIQMAIKQIKGS